MTIVLSPHTEALLSEKARSEGKEINSFADGLLSSLLTRSNQGYANI